MVISKTRLTVLGVASVAVLVLASVLASSIQPSHGNGLGLVEVRQQLDAIGESWRREQIARVWLQYSGFNISNSVDFLGVKLYLLNTTISHVMVASPPSVNPSYVLKAAQVHISPIVGPNGLVDVTFRLKDVKLAIIYSDRIIELSTPELTVKSSK